MSKSYRRNDKQLSIFELLKQVSRTTPTTEGQLKMIDPLRIAMRSAIKGCPLSRHQIAGEMSHLIGETVTKEMIDSWTREDQVIEDCRLAVDDWKSPSPGPSHQGRGNQKRIVRHVPAEYLAAFCKVTGSVEPLRVLGEAAGFFVLPGPEALRAEIQKIEEEIRAAQDRKKKRVMFLREMQKTEVRGERSEDR